MYVCLWWGNMGGKNRLILDYVQQSKYVEISSRRVIWLIRDLYTLYIYDTMYIQEAPRHFSNAAGNIHRVFTSTWLYIYILYIYVRISSWIRITRSHHYVFRFNYCFLSKQTKSFCISTVAVYSDGSIGSCGVCAARFRISRQEMKERRKQ